MLVGEGGLGLELQVELGELGQLVGFGGELCGEVMGCLLLAVELLL